MPYYKSPKFSVWNYFPKITLPDNEKHLRQFLKNFGSDAVIVDIGSGGRFISDDIITFDRYCSEKVKVIGDVHDLPFKDSVIDCIVCTGTLEHITNPWRVAEEIKRVLKPGGFCYIGAPFMQGYHPDPGDYWRFSLDGLQLLFGDFKVVEKGVSAGSGSGLSWAVVDFFRAISDSHYMSEMCGVIARYLFFWLKYFDRLLKNKKNNVLFASGYYIICEKS